MSEIVSTISYRRLRAPAEDGGALFEPPVADEAAFLHQNIALREQTDCDLRGCSLSELRLQARELLLAQASQYTRAYRDVSPGALEPTAPVILMGHQPELVHPGVWFKNFLLSELAHRTSSYAVNLLVDNDSISNCSIRVPAGSPRDPVAMSIAYDAPAAACPYEAREIQDPGLFRSFSERVSRAITPLVQHPLIESFWPLAVAAGHQHRNLGRAVAQARHTLEGHWGLESLELPLSTICDSRPFRWIAACLMGDAPHLRELHNACVSEYRRVNKVRSHTHPVPDLIEDDGWVEVPFWLWSVNDPLRRPAFVRRRQDRVLLSDRGALTIPLDLKADGEVGRCVEQLEDAYLEGVRLRPRAMITTMFARLVLSDIFIHGIGGAKYDQVTDAIVRRFFAVEPPEYVVATATLKLPVPHLRVESADLLRVRQLLRELCFHPELHVDPSPEARRLIEEKHRWIAANGSHNDLRERHLAIERINEALHAMLATRQQQLQDELQELRSLLRKRAILDSREYAFCLFPEASLRERLLDLSRQ